MLRLASLSSEVPDDAELGHFFLLRGASRMTGCPFCGLEVCTYIPWLAGFGGPYGDDDDPRSFEEHCDSCGWVCHGNDDDCRACRFREGRAIDLAISIVDALRSDLDDVAARLRHRLER
jgi:hypothetical protein